MNPSTRRKKNAAERAKRKRLRRADRGERMVTVFSGLSYQVMPWSEYIKTGQYKAFRGWVDDTHRALHGDVDES